MKRDHAIAGSRFNVVIAAIFTDQDTRITTKQHTRAQTDNFFV